MRGELKDSQNLHSHTVYCDGTLTPEEMVRAAIEKGCGSFGLSGHSYAPFDTKHCMSLEDTRRYLDDSVRLKEKYAGEIELFFGIEQDYYSEGPPAGYDFVIGSVHYLKIGDKFVTVDGGARSQKMVVDEYFGGDYYAMAEEYFAAVADIGITGADIVGHFDLVKKYCFDGNLFDETDPRYVAAAMDAMGEILKERNLFEVNTGAMFRLGKPDQYPSTVFLKELHKRGGEVILSSDSHDAESICWKFDEMAELLKACGFSHIKRLTGDGFINVDLK